MTVLSSLDSEESHADTGPPFVSGRMAAVEPEDCCLSMASDRICNFHTAVLCKYITKFHFLCCAHACRAIDTCSIYGRASFPDDGCNSWPGNEIGTYD